MGKDKKKKSNKKSEFCLIEIFRAFKKFLLANLGLKE